MAEREGFEPPAGSHLHLISNQAPSTTRPSLHNYERVARVARLSAPKRLKEALKQRSARVFLNA